jgi:hypothetical protein
MYQRIRELAVKADLYVDVDGQPWPRNMNGEDIEGAYQKFAQLIVEECGEIAYKAYWDNPETVRGIHIKEKIKQHFGAEE